mgnify:CR=1 FL=1
MAAPVPTYPAAHGLLAGKTVVVTAAAGTGIGFSLAKRCVEEGATVLISDLHERRLGEAADNIEARRAPVRRRSSATSPTRSRCRGWSQRRSKRSATSTCG